MPPSQFFNEDMAAHYDSNRAHLMAIGDAKHLLISFAFTSLPEDAQILCVGVGTGDEIIALAKTHPGWRFTALDPAPAMLAQCRAKLETLGLAGRCTFVEGYVEDLTLEAHYHGALSLLVSHFIMDRAARIAFFAAIYDRLKPGGILINSDISTDMKDRRFDAHFRLWTHMLKSTPMPEEHLTRILESYGRDVSVEPHDSLEEILNQAGFPDPIKIYQAFFITAWMSVKG